MLKTVPCIVLAIGKPNPFVIAQYRRIKANPLRRLTIAAAQSLEKPVGKRDLERHFLKPLVEQVFGDCPDLDDVKFLSRLGICTSGVTVDGVYGMFKRIPLPDDLVGEAQFDATAKLRLATRLAESICMTGDFFLRPNPFCARLRCMSPQELAPIDRARLDFFNQPYREKSGESALKKPGVTGRAS